MKSKVHLEIFVKGSLTINKGGQKKSEKSMDCHEMQQMQVIKSPTQTGVSFSAFHKDLGLQMPIIKNARVDDN